ncbi:Phage shock protein A, PspA [Acidithiobacillus ferrivorans]|uniref:Phage shock protein A, PspA n=1 Tax=Acidithiobacillus ferrivorans TaxID=160808 RepID=A0A060UP08_9PROT|nr:PspA/IM30 family protein [Acidithiobacillus ferrivorans]CDQ10190.1 Putative Phage shock protein A (PspA) [Acidithiobacillus ferrivorans]SMH64149.1 Phage shock protein A, PspA [Acidithiobacillus ferrivorans]
MSIFKHAAEILEGKVNHFLDNAEDPGESLDLSYEKMITNLQDTKRHLADVVTERVSLENQMAQAQKAADKADADARMALGANREDLVRAELAQKQSELQKIASLKEAHDTVAAQAQKLTDYESKLQDHIEQFRTQKEITKSELAAAQAEVKVSQSLTGIGKGMDGAGDAMRRAQDRTQHMAAKAVAMDGLMESGALNDPLDNRSQTEKELDNVRVTNGVDDDLARLKAEMTKDKGTA